MLFFFEICFNFLDEKDTIVIYYNNQSGICLSENLVFHDLSKHIDIRYHFIRDMVQRGASRLHLIKTDE